jgi:uncharacterized protein (DUF608 family)
METKLFKILVSLGVPGVGLGVFFLLFNRFEWSFEQIPSEWAGPIVVVFMILVFLITYKIIGGWQSNELSKAQTESGDPYQQFIGDIKRSVKIPDMTIEYSASDSDVEVKCRVFGKIRIIHFSKKEILANPRGCIRVFEAKQNEWLVE